VFLVNGNDDSSEEEEVKNPGFFKKFLRVLCCYNSGSNGNTFLIISVKY